MIVFALSLWVVYDVSTKHDGAAVIHVRSISPDHQSSHSTYVAASKCAIESVVSGGKEVATSKLLVYLILLYTMLYNNSFKYFLYHFLLFYPSMNESLTVHSVSQWVIDLRVQTDSLTHSHSHTEWLTAPKDIILTKQDK